MRNNILIISTRKIFEKDSIFKNAERCDKTSDGLRRYLVDYLNCRIRSIGTKDESGNDITLESMPTVIQDYLKEKNACFLDANLNSESESKVNISNDLSEEQIVTIKKSLKYFPQTSIQNISRSLKEDKRSALKKILTELRDQFQLEKNVDKQNEIETFYKDINGIMNLLPAEGGEEENRQDIGFLNIEMKYDDIEKYLEYDAINIDKEVGYSSSSNSDLGANSRKLTIRDRISFYKILSEEYNDEKYIIYAVWPLGHRDKPRISKEGNTLPCWEDCLTDDFVVNTDSQSDDSNKDKVLLLLHDNDIEKWKETPFKTVFANRSYGNSSVDRSLAVFQHSNNCFLNIVNYGGGAKKIVEHAEAVIVNDWYVYYLRDLSSFLSSYTGNADDKDFLDKLEQVKKIFKKEQDKDFLRNCYLLTNADNKVEQVYDANLEINEMIKELRNQ